MIDNSAIWAIVLAAGKSSRMDRPKLVLPFGKGTIIEDVIRNIINSGIENIIVVTGAWEKEILTAISSLKVRHLRNENYKNGMLSSVISGIKSLPAETRAALIFQGDQPGISPEVVRKMTDTFKHGSKGIVIPVHLGRRGHPLLVSSAYFNIIPDLDPDSGLRSLLPMYADDITEIEVNDDKILRDIDTIEDYKISVK